MDNQMENQVIEQLQNQIQHLLNQVQDLSMHVAAQPQSLSFGKSLRKPPEYDGKDRKACATFLSHLNLYISGNPTLFPNDAAKVTFAASYLRDRAFSWFEPYLLDKKAPIRYDFDLFTKELLKNLGDPDRIRTLTRDLQTLTQSGSASDYTARFYQISSYLSWNDNALRDQYYTGLKPAVKDALAYSNSDPDTLKELSDLAIRLDNRLFERRIETRKTNDKREHRTGTSTPRYNQSSNSTSARTGPVPMDIDATKHNKPFKPLTPEERKRRMDNNLCLYCGEAGHRVPQCPQRNKPRPAQLRATINPESDVDLLPRQSLNGSA
jgi:hypothetical protein